MNKLLIYWILAVVWLAVSAPARALDAPPGGFRQEALVIVATTILPSRLLKRRSRWRTDL